MKIISTAALTLLVVFQLEAQVKFNLHYQAETKTFTVSILPERTWAAPLNKVGAAQIILRVPAGAAFSPAVTTLVNGVVWSDNAYVENLPESPGLSYIAIAMVNGPTDQIPLTEGQEVPLFSFVSATGACPEKIELPANDDPAVRAVIAAGYNVTQHLAVLGARGNAYAGIGEGLVLCNGQTSAAPSPDAHGFQQVQIAPIPANDQTTVSWVQTRALDGRVELVVTNTLGQEVYREQVPGAEGKHAAMLRVKNWKPGLYSLTFQNAAGRISGAHNLLVLH